MEVFQVTLDKINGLKHMHSMSTLTLKHIYGLVPF